MPPTQVTFEVHAVPASIEMGLWCPECALPSAVAQTMLLVAPASLRVVRRWRSWICTDCGRATHGPLSA